MAAIAALTPSHPEAEPTSPTSPTSIFSFSEDLTWHGRRVSNAGSFDSTHSRASSTTSFYTDVDMEYSPKGLGSFSFPAPPRATSPTKIYANQSTDIVTTPRPQSPAEDKLASETASFTSLLCSHLRNVQALKDRTSVPSVRFSVPSPRASPSVAERRCSLWLEGEGESDSREAVRRTRKARQWRPRFDPTETKKLCAEALEELA